MTKTVPSGIAASTYGVNATATSGTFTGTGTANVTVAAPALSVSLLGSGSYTKGGTASFTATVLNGTTPVVGASVLFTMTKPNGGNVTQTATTGTTGAATWSYKFTQMGNYLVVANGTYNSQTAASNSATFTVH
jgi:hypothetical protein